MRLPSRAYYKYTDYNKVPSGLKKLDFIVRSIYGSQRDPDNTKIKILDIGCGNGNIAIPLASIGYSLVGIDIDRPSIEKAMMKNCVDNAKFKVMDAGKLTAEEKFDFVVCSEVLEHLQNPFRFLKSMTSLLSKKGFLIITIPNGYGPYELTAHFKRISEQFALARGVKKFLGKLIHSSKTAMPSVQTSNVESPHANFFRFSAIKRALRSNGFTVIKTRHSDFISGIFTALRLNFPKRLWKVDCLIADYLPHCLVFGWYFLCQKSM